jgi:hypothetical protein
MHYYRVCLPSRNAFNDEYETWIERSFTSGKVDTLEIDLDDDIHGIIRPGWTIDDIPILVGETDEETIIN